MSDKLTQAIKEAYASAPTDVRILHTMELRHPTFKDDEGLPMAIRVVLEKVGGRSRAIDLRLEPDAPLHPSQSVPFRTCTFGLSLPGMAEGRLPELEIWIDNVSKEVMPHLVQAVSRRAKLECSYREFIAGDDAGPHFVLHGLTMRRVKANLFRTSGTAGFFDFLNRRYGEVYTVTRFPGLAR